MVVASLKSPVQAQNVFAELLDSLIVDVAAEAHRAARLGFDYRLDNEEEEEAQMSAHARATVGDVDIGGSETGGKYTFDVFGLSHPTIAQDMFDCMNCGHPIVAGRFAPHLEKCMGKGRKARLKSNTGTSGHQRRGRTTPVSSMANSTAAYGNRAHRPVRSFASSIPEDSQRSLMDFNGAASEGSPEDDKDVVPGLQHSGKARSKKNSSARASTMGAEG